MLQEFHLRALEAGLDNAESIAIFLNLPPEVSRLTMGELLRDGYVFPRREAPAADGNSYLLTEDGRKLLGNWLATVAVEKVVQFQYDAVLAAPVHYSRELIVSARQADLDGLLCLPTRNTEPPDIAPADTPLFRLAYSQSKNSASETLISLVQAEGSYETQYLVATAYLFESTDDDRELALRIVVDGRISDQHDTSILEHGFIESLKIPGQVDEGRRQVDNVLGEFAVAARVSDSEVASLLSELAIASDVVTGGSDSGQPSQVVLDQAEKTEERLTGIQVRRLSIQEQFDLWPSVVQLATNSLMIVSDNLEGNYWREVLEIPVRQCLERGVGVFVGYRSSTFWSPVDGKQQRVFDVFASLKSEFPNFSIEQVKRSGANAIVIDNDTVIVSKFSWLALPGRLDHGFADDRGTFVRTPDFVRDIVKRVRSLS